MATAPNDATQARPTLNRVIRIAGGADEVRVALEDDFHHFLLTLTHGDGLVRDLRTEGPRAPWTLCAAAGLELKPLIGTPITTDVTALFRRTDARHQCTHQLDMAALAIAAAARGTPRRDYRIEVDDAGPRPRHARLWRDGAPLLDWTLEGYAIAAPEALAGRGLGAGFTAWVADALAPEEAEAALVLRRGVFIAGGRGMAARLDGKAHASVNGGCWVQQPAQAPRALRRRGSQLDFTGRAAALTRDDEAWLAADRGPSKAT